MEEIKKIFKHLLIAFSIAFSAVMIFLFIILDISGGINGFGIFGVIMGGIVIIFYAIIFIVYFLFKIKNSKLLLKCIIVLFAIQIILTIMQVFDFDLDYYLRNLFNNSHLPEQYNEYQDLKKPVLEFKNKEMKLLVGDCNNLNQYLSPQNNLIVGRCGWSKPKHTYYKFDSRGNFMDKYSYTFESHEVLFEGYIICADNGGYYKTWVFDGDTLKRKMKTYNKQFRLDSIKQNAFVAAIQKKATFLFSEDYTKGRGIKHLKHFQKIVFLKDNKWNIFYYDAKRYKTIKDKGIDMYHSDLFSPHTDTGKRDRSTASKNIQSLYFQKINLEGSSTRTETWSGYLYTNIIVGKDTLKIKDSSILEFEYGKAIKDPLRESQEHPRYFYYSNPNLEYQLFLNFIEEIYIIKDKPKIQKKT